ncbi:MAG TPA: IucA/IucC family protein [Polyangiaceae bacterium]|nr:IucA/IucC family protein [Polyangiaceae bacterium]
MRVLRQLVEALLFERVAMWSSERHPAHGGLDEELSFGVGSSWYCCRGRVGAFGRVRVVDGSVRKVEQRQARPVSWQELLEDVPGSPASKAELAGELENTARLCRWNAESLPALRRSRRGLHYDELESLLHEGHPYHPCFKSRTGFSLADHAAYGPEAGNTFALRWLAVRRSALRQQRPLLDHESFETSAGSRLSDARQQARAPIDEFGLLPVHPWQWRKLQGMPALAEGLARRELIDLELELGRYRATQSLRTLIPVEDHRGDHVKLPLALRNSSSLRTLQPETVHAAPAVSAWLKGLVQGDAFFDEVAGAVVLAEHHSAAYSPLTPETAALESNLAVIWREPIERHLRADEAALPFNALFALEADGRPFIEPWIERHGLATWLGRLLRVTLLPLWRLLAHHGVALEAHAQNLLLLHRDGMPERLALRDFHDSLEYVPSFLAEPESAPDFTRIDRRFEGAGPGRHYAMSSVLELRDLFIDTVMVFNLSELSWLLEREYGFRETEFWRLARGVLGDYRRSRWNDAGRAERIRLGAAFVHTESLLKARLSAPTNELLKHVVPSDLHEQVEREIHAGHQ